MSAETWGAIDRFLGDLLVGEDPVMDAVLTASAAAGLPPIQVSPLQGKFLMLLERALGAVRVLEIGTLAGYSTIWLARGLAPGGRVITIELDERRGAIARENVARAGFGDVVDLRIGPALDILDALVAEGVPPFDFVFLDADRPRYDQYFRSVLRLSRPGTLLVADNVVRAGAVTDPSVPDAGAQGVRRFLEAVAVEPRVSAMALQTVSGKGHDGFAVVRVEEA